MVEYVPRRVSAPSCTSVSERGGVIPAALTSAMVSSNHGASPAKPCPGKTASSNRPISLRVSGASATGECKSSRTRSARWRGTAPSGAATHVDTKPTGRSASRARDASKVALCHLAGRLSNSGYTLLDTQFLTHHLRQFGAIEIDRPDYKARLATAIKVAAVFQSELSADELEAFIQSTTQTS